MGTLVVGLISLIRESAGPDFVMMGMLAFFMALRIVPVKLALDGFRNEGLLTVAGTFVFKFMDIYLYLIYFCSLYHRFVRFTHC